jgi:photosystem II stability/assembly factor-like uncharacterized protein
MQSGLQVLRVANGRREVLGEFFPDQVVDTVAGGRARPEIVFVGVTYDGVYRTRDNGLHWERVLEGDIRAVAVDPNDERVVYAGTEPVRLYRSTDGGDTWETLDNLLQLPDEVKKKWWFPQPPHIGHIRNVFIQPDDSNLLLLALEHGGIVRSFDGGDTWEDVSEGLFYPDMHVLGNYPGSRSRYFASSARAFFRTDDAAHGWERSEDGMPWAYSEKQSYSHDWLLLPGDPPSLLLAGANGSPAYWARPTGAEGVILRSDDGGEHWERMSEGLPDPMRWMVWALVHHPSDPSTVYAGMGDVARGHVAGPRGSGAFYVSRDRGSSWEALATELPAVRVTWVSPDA